MRFSEFFTRRPRLRSVAFGMLAICATGGVFAAVRIVHTQQVDRNAERLLASARAALRNQDPKPAVELYEQYFGLCPDDQSARAEYAGALDEVATTPKARNRVFLTYEDVLRHQPDSIRLRRRLVEVALELGRTPDALFHLNTLRKTEPEDSWCWLQTARARQVQAHFSEAADAARESLRLDPRNLAAAELLSDLWTNRLEQADDVGPMLDQVVIDNPRSERALRLRAEFRISQRRPELAEDDLTQALEMAPNDRDLLRVACRWGLAMLRTDLSPNDPEKRSRILEQTRQRLTHGIAAFPESIDFHPLLADLEESLGDDGKAKVALRHALERFPRDVRLLTRLAELEIRGNQLEEARRLTERIPDGSITKPLKHYLLARQAMQVNHWREAREQLEEALIQAVETPELTNHITLLLAECERHDGHREQEAAAYRRVLRNAPDNDAARLGLARLALRRDQFDEALAEFRQLMHRVELLPEVAEALLQRNARLPDEARDWKEFDRILARLIDRGHQASIGQSLRKRASEIGRPTSADSVASSGDATVFSGRPDGSISNARRQAEMHLARRDAQAAKTSTDWLLQHDAGALSTTQLEAWRLVVAGEGEAAARLIESEAARHATPGANARPVALALLARQLNSVVRSIDDGAADGEGAVALENQAFACLQNELRAAPNDLVLLAAYWAIESRRAPPDWTTEAAWEEWRQEVADDPSLIIRWSVRLDPSDFKRLETIAAKLVAQSPSHTEITVGLADLEALHGRYELAERGYRHALKSDPTEIHALNNLAWLLALQRKAPNEAAELIDHAIKLAGAEPRLLDTRGCVALARGDLKAALADFEASLAEQPVPVTALHLAQARLLNGDRHIAAHAMKLLANDGIVAERLHPLERVIHESIVRSLQSKPARTP